MHVTHTRTLFVCLLLQPEILSQNTKLVVSSVIVINAVNYIAHGGSGEVL